MKRLLPSPLLSLALAALWLLLNGLSLGHALIAALLAVLAPLLSAPLRPTQTPVRRLDVLLRLVSAVGSDVWVSALQVARGVLGGMREAPEGRFVRIPLELRENASLAALAVITTAVPGTVWTELAADRRSVLLHVFDLGEGVDEAGFIADYKQRYERPLREIFE